LAGIYFWLSKSEKDLIDTSYRKCFKSFMGLPPATPNLIVASLIGDVGRILSLCNGICEIKNNCRRERRHLSD